MHWIGLWAVNFSLEVHEVQPTIHSRDLETNTRKAIALNLLKYQQLCPTWSTEFIFFVFKMIESRTDADNEGHLTAPKSRDRHRAFSLRSGSYDVSAERARVRLFGG